MHRLIASSLVALGLIAAFVWPAQTAVRETGLPASVSADDMSGEPLIAAFSAELVDTLNAAAADPGMVTRSSGTPNAPLADLPEGSYRVQPGDSLYTISLRAYGTTRGHDAILRANRGVIENADSLRAGLILQIPDYGN